MSRPAYSVRFCCFGFSAAEVSYTVPAGYVAVVRDIVFTAQADSTDTFSAFVATVEGPSYVIFAGVFSDSANTHWEGRQVLNAGDVLYIVGNTTSEDITGVASGYLLSS